MVVPYAEVIGDPIAHSKSPLIHGFWLEKLGLEGEYRAARVSIRELPRYLEAKRTDRRWRGCNVTAPLKGEAAALVGVPPAICTFVGAVNCITRTPLGCLVGTNTDIAGIAEALKGVKIEGRDVLLIGAGGAARAALCHLAREGAGKITLAVRDSARAESLKHLSERIEVASFEASAAASPSLVVNATPLGMAQAPAMPGALLSVAGAAEVVLDMVYAPTETPLLAAARKAGARAIDGLSMLIGQAAPAFELFFGARPPEEHDEELRELLTQ